MATVLIVDDRETNRLLLRTLLGYQDHQVVEARDGEEALEMALLHNPDLIITNILMPHVDGYEFLRNLRNEPTLVKTPVIVYTATFIEAEARALAERCGVFRVMLRPAPPEEILLTVEAALNTNSPVVEAPPDETFGVEHRRLLSEKLVQKVDAMEVEVGRRLETEARLVAALSASRQKVFELDVPSRRLTVIESDIETGEVVEKNIPYEEYLQSINPEDLHSFSSELEDAAQSFRSIFAQYRSTYGGHGERVVELRGSYANYEEAGPTKLYGAIADVTERAAEQHQKLLMASVVELSVDFIGSARLDGTVMFINPAGLKMIGLDPSGDWKSKSMYSHVHPQDLPFVRDVAIPQLLKHGEWRGELQMLKAETGAPIPCECCSFVIPDADGEVSGVAMVARDIRERKEALRQSNMRLSQLTALHRIDVAISGSIDLQLTLQIVVNEVLTIAGVEAACFLIYDPHMRQLDFASGRGIPQDEQLTKLGDAAVLERRAIRDSIENGATMEALPLVAKGVVKGVLVIVYSADAGQGNSLTQFVEAIASQAAIALDNALMFEDLQRSKNDLAIAYDETLEGWSRALDMRDKETEGHSRRVTDITMRLAREMRVPSELLQHMRRGALLHDIGKVGVPDSILLKPGRLTDEEMALMRKHTDYAADFLGCIAYLRPAMDIPYCHHEKWDGTGYPRGLKGTQIPLSARIFAVADVWDALMSDRPYRKAWPREKVVEHIKAGSGTHFDPAVISAFQRILNTI